MAQRNNTWSMHVHVGVRGADRAIAVCDHAARPCCRRCSRCRRTRRSSTAEDTGLHSVRTEIFTRTFPAAASTSRSATGRPTPTSSTCSTATELDRRVDPAVVERAPPPRLRHGRGADLRRADAMARSRSTSPR